IRRRPAGRGAGLSRRPAAAEGDAIAELTGEAGGAFDSRLAAGRKPAVAAAGARGVPGGRRSDAHLGRPRGTPVARASGEQATGLYAVQEPDAAARGPDRWNRVETRACRDRRGAGTSVYHRGAFRWPLHGVGAFRADAARR